MPRGPLPDGLLMFAYIIRRLVLIPPTLLGIMALNFFVIQVAPGGPVEQVLAKIQGTAVGATTRFSGGGSENLSTNGGATLGGQGQTAGDGGTGGYRGARGLDPRFIAQIEKEFGFDKPLGERFIDMIGKYATFDFGQSFFRSASVIDLVLEKLPVSVTLGLWTTLIIYGVSIPLGIRKAVRDGSNFDFWSTNVILVLNAIPTILFAVLLIVLFAGGRYFSWFPLRGLVSENWADLPWYQQILDYLWHAALPILTLVIGSFAGLTLLTKNAFIEQIRQQYVLTARAKGLTERRVLYGHVFRNAMIVVIAGIPGALVGILLTGTFLVESIFNLDGLGLLGWEAAINRDYPVMFATLYVFTLIGLLLNLISDLMLPLIDPRIDFERRQF